MLREFGVLAKETRTSVYKTRDAAYVPFFKRSEDNNFVFCCDIPGLLMKMGIYTQVENDWWLFIDGSTRSVKAVLLHNENAYPAIPIAYSITAKKSYETMKSILQLVCYDTFQWRVCSDLKVVGLLTGMQGGYVKYTCFICLWDSCAKHEHFIRNEWPARGNVSLGVHNIQYEPLVQSDKVIIPPLHIKLGLFKNFVKALRSNSEPMKIIKETFPKLSLAKVKEGVFVGPDTRKLLKSQQFTDSLSPFELRAWKALKECVENFLGKYLKVLGIKYIILVFYQRISSLHSFIQASTGRTAIKTSSQNCYQPSKKLMCTCPQRFTFCIAIWTFSPSILRETLQTSMENVSPNDLNY